MILPKADEVGIKSHKDEIWVITDVRFENEAIRIKELGGYIVEINRPNFFNNDSHISEERLPDDLISYIINNNASLNQFEERVIEAVGQLVN